MANERLIRPWKQPCQNTYIFRHANVVDPVDGSILPNRTVKISGGLVESITDESEKKVNGMNGVKDPTVVIVVDLEGKYLCPGLIDAHVHMVAVPGEEDLGSLMGLDKEIISMRQPYVCQQMLHRGFTTARDCGGGSLALKEAINEGVIQGPRLFIAGHGLTQTGGHADSRGRHDHTSCCGGTKMALGHICDGVPECIKAAREELRTGADFIKIMAGGGVASPTDKLESVQFTAEEVRAISTVAHNSNTYVTAHAYTPSSIRHAIDNGVTGIEHGNLIDAETAKYMAEKGVFLTPTLTTYSEMASPEFPGFLPDESRVKNEEVLRAGLRSLQIAFDAGVTMCYGTDLLGPMGISQSKEFAIRSQVLSSKVILQSATINPARMLRQEAYLGQIKPGFAADIIVLNDNPLEDIRILGNPDKHMLAILKEGRVYYSRWRKLPQDVVSPAPIIE